jgi:hypothetical protein
MKCRLAFIKHWGGNDETLSRSSQAYRHYCLGDVLGRRYYIAGAGAVSTGAGMLSGFVVYSSNQDYIPGEIAMGTEEELIEIIAEEMFEARNEGVFSALPESQKDAWLLDAGYIAEAILRKWVSK